MPPHTSRSLFERVMASSWNYWFMLVADIVAAGGFLALGLHLGSSAPYGIAAVIGGVCAWGAVEYAMHRFVLHGPPSVVQRAHARHHREADALISAPAFLSASLALIVWMALTVVVEAGTAALAVGGLYCGYNYYAVLHHIQHHHPAVVARIPWLAALDRAHRIHHRFYVVNYGVTTGWCDRLFRSDAPSSPVVARRLGQTPLPGRPLWRWR